MNDIYTVNDEFSSTLYADDSTLEAPLGSFTESIGNTHFENISQFQIAHKLALNLGKTFMLFHNPQKIIDDFQLNLVIDNYEIDNNTSFDFIKTAISSTLNWKNTFQKYLIR